jgi:metal-responsive CopG/Arc/MetJ family transcriptional regulator
MLQVLVTIPDEFLQPLDELVARAQVASREEFVRNAIRELLINYEVTKEFDMPMRGRYTQLAAFFKK